MARYILSIGDSRASAPSLPVRGAYTPPSGSADAPKGVLVLRAAYTDRGANGMPEITKDKTIVLRSPSVVTATGELSEGVSKQSVPEVPFDITVVSRPGGSVALKQIDLTGINAVVFSAVAPARFQARGGKIEVRLDSPTGALLGESELIRPTTDSTARPYQLRTPLAPTAGVHDVYFVFRSLGTTGDSFMFGLMTATFETARSRNMPR
jgi:cytochrome c